MNLIAEFEKAVIWIGTKDKPDAALSQPVGDVSNTCRKKMKMPRVRAGVERYRGEEDHNWLTQRVSQIHCNIQGGIVAGSLRALHPVNDTTSLGAGSP